MEFYRFVILVGLTTLAFYPTIAAPEASPVTCPELIPSEGVNLTCANEQGQPVDCLERAKVGATANFKCLPFYENERSSLAVMCKSDGKWFPSRSYECQVDCGRQNPDYEGYIVNGYLANVTHWPWHATIFRKSAYRKGEHEYHYICGGALISPTLILTAAHCAVNGQGHRTPPENLRVVLFAGSSDYKAIMQDSNSKILKVTAIEYHQKYNAWNYDNDIALFRLSETIQYSKFVRPVCYPRNNDKSMRMQAYHLSPSSSGYVVGFGKDETGKVSRLLKETKIPVISARDCADVIGKVHNSGQYCAGYLNGTAACSGDSGGGMYFSYKSAGEERFIVQGLVSHAKRGKCDSFTIFSNVGNFAQWIEDTEYKYHAIDVENEKKKQSCTALQLSPNVTVKCFENPVLGSGMANMISCRSARPKDIAKFSCQANFMEKIVSFPTVKARSAVSWANEGVAVCQDDGAWSQRSIECEPECGKSAGRVPWHAKIFLFLTRKDMVARGYLCGGSLIENSFILTSASCILSKGGKIPYSFLRVVLGSNPLTQIEDFTDPNLQILTVKNVWIAPAFNFASFSGNLALIQLNSEAKLTKNVKRVCYLRPETVGRDNLGFEGALPNYLYNLRTGSDEMITKPMVLSSAICTGTQALKIGSSQYCSYISPSTEICKNDTGSGLVRTSGKQGKELSVLKGVLSHGYLGPESKSFCTLNSHVVYERIEPYGTWIKEKILEGSRAIHSVKNMSTANSSGNSNLNQKIITAKPVDIIVPQTTTRTTTTTQSNSTSSTELRVTTTTQSIKKTTTTEKYETTSKLVFPTSPTIAPLGTSQIPIKQSGTSVDTSAFPSTILRATLAPSTTRTTLHPNTTESVNTYFKPLQSTTTTPARFPESAFTTISPLFVYDLKTTQMPSNSTILTKATNSVDSRLEVTGLNNNTNVSSVKYLTPAPSINTTNAINYNNLTNTSADLTNKTADEATVTAAQTTVLLRKVNSIPSEFLTTCPPAGINPLNSTQVKSTPFVSTTMISPGANNTVNTPIKNNATNDTTSSSTMKVTTFNTTNVQPVSPENLPFADKSNVSFVKAQVINIVDNTTNAPLVDHTTVATIVTINTTNVPVVNININTPMVNSSTTEVIFNNTNNTPVLTNIVEASIPSNIINASMANNKSDATIIHYTTNAPIASNITASPTVNNPTNEAIVNITNEASINITTKDAIANNKTIEPIVSNLPNEAIVNNKTNEAIVNNTTNKPIVTNTTNESTANNKTNEATANNKTIEQIVSNLTNEANLKKKTIETIVNNKTFEPIVSNLPNEAIANIKTIEPVFNNVTNETLLNNKTNEAVLNNKTNEATVNNPTNEATTNNTTGSSIIQNTTKAPITSNITTASNQPILNSTATEPIVNTINVAIVNNTTNGSIDNITANEAVVNNTTIKAIIISTTDVPVANSTINTAMVNSPTIEPIVNNTINGTIATNMIEPPNPRNVINAPMINNTTDALNVNNKITELVIKNMTNSVTVNSTTGEQIVNNKLVAAIVKNTTNRITTSNMTAMPIVNNTTSEVQINNTIDNILSNTINASITNNITDELITHDVKQIPIAGNILNIPLVNNNTIEPIVDNTINASTANNITDATSMHNITNATIESNITALPIVNSTVEAIINNVTNQEIRKTTNEAIINNITTEAIASNATNKGIINDRIILAIASNVTDSPIANNKSNAVMVSNTTDLPIVNNTKNVSIANNATDLAMTHNTPNASIMNNAINFETGSSAHNFTLPNSTFVQIINNTPTSSSISVQPVISKKSNEVFVNLLLTGNNTVNVLIANATTIFSALRNTTDARNELPTAVTPPVHKISLPSQNIVDGASPAPILSESIINTTTSPQISNDSLTPTIFNGTTTPTDNIAAVANGNNDTKILIIVDSATTLSSVITPTIIANVSSSIFTENITNAITIPIVNKNAELLINNATVPPIVKSDTSTPTIKNTSTLPDVNNETTMVTAIMNGRTIQLGINTTTTLSANSPSLGPITAPIMNNGSEKSNVDNAAPTIVTATTTQSNNNSLLIVQNGSAMPFVNTSTLTPVVSNNVSAELEKNASTTPTFNHSSALPNADVNSYTSTVMTNNTTMLFIINDTAVVTINSGPSVLNVNNITTAPIMNGAHINPPVNTSYKSSNDISSTQIVTTRISGSKDEQIEDIVKNVTFASNTTNQPIVNKINVSVNESSPLNVSPIINDAIVAQTTKAPIFNKGTSAAAATYLTHSPTASNLKTNLNTPENSVLTNQKSRETVAQEFGVAQIVKEEKQDQINEGITSFRVENFKFIKNTSIIPTVSAPNVMTLENTSSTSIFNPEIIKTYIAPFLNTIVDFIVPTLRALIASTTSSAPTAKPTSASIIHGISTPIVNATIDAGAPKTTGIVQVQNTTTEPLNNTTNALILSHIISEINVNNTTFCPSLNNSGIGAYAVNTTIAPRNILPTDASSTQKVISSVSTKAPTNASSVVWYPIKPESESNTRITSTILKPGSIESKIYLADLLIDYIKTMLYFKVANETADFPKNNNSGNVNSSLIYASQISSTAS